MKTIIPDRYSESQNDRYKYINVYEIYKDYVKLLIVEKLGNTTKLTLLFDKDDFKKVSEHHWGGTKGVRPPCTHDDKKCITIGQFISGSDFRIYGKIKGKSMFDFRMNRYSETGNIYTSIGKDKMKLKIYRRDSEPFSVIFDKEDYTIISEHIWMVEKDRIGTYSVLSMNNNKRISMHSYLLKAHGQRPGNKGFKDIEYKDYIFDYRKSVLLKKNALNIYSIINSTTMELAINSVHGVIKIIFDMNDYERVSGIGWGYKRNGLKCEILNYKYGQLKRFILGSTDKKFRYIIVKKDKSNRFDFRRKTLLDCLK